MRALLQAGPTSRKNEWAVIRLCIPSSDIIAISWPYDFSLNAVDPNQKGLRGQTVLLVSIISSPLKQIQAFDKVVKNSLPMPSMTTTSSTLRSETRSV